MPRGRAGLGGRSVRYMSSETTAKKFKLGPALTLSP